MGNFLKSVKPLVVARDGRLAEKWNSYKVQLEYALSGKEIGGIFLDDVLLGQDEGAKVADLGGSKNAWVNRETGRIADQYEAAVLARKRWARANKEVVSSIMATVPDELQEARAERLVAKELWSYSSNDSLNRR